jgi:hypothetical protein
LTINPAKCVFAVSSLKFLGHMVDEAGITPLPRPLPPFRTARRRQTSSSFSDF